MHASHTTPIPFVGTSSDREPDADRNGTVRRSDCATRAPGFKPTPCTTVLPSACEPSVKMRKRSTVAGVL